MKHVKRPEEYGDGLTHNNGLYKTIIEGDKYAFNKKHITEEICGMVLWLVICGIEYSNKTFGWLWKTGLFFIAALGGMWILRFLWWFLMHVMYDVAMKLQAKEKKDK